MEKLPFGLRPELSPGAKLEPVGKNTWRLVIPAGDRRRYRLAQVDNYFGLPRRKFPHDTPFHLELKARASQAALPGTWGFGLWNDPFGMGFLVGRGLRLPVLPNAAWFFFASPENHLSLLDDLPGNGALAATFRSPRWPSGLLLAGSPFLALLPIPASRRLLRRLLRKIIHQDAVSLKIDPSEWHGYCLQWENDEVRFQVDGKTVLRTGVMPLGPLGLVIWIDNQFAAFRPDGDLGYGMLAYESSAWIEIKELCCE